MSYTKSQYIYRIQLKRPELLTKGPTDEEARILQDHVSYLDNLASESIVLLAGRTQTDDPDGFGIVILNAESEEQALEIMHNDPAVKYSVMSAEFFPYKIAALSDSIVQVNDNDS